MIKQLVAVYKRKDCLYLRSESRTSVGIIIETGYPIVEPHDAPPERLGKDILKLLKQSEWNIPHPADPNEGSVTKPLLEAAGVKSWSTFQKGALYCGIISDKSELKFRPYENKGRGGFVPMPDNKIIAIPSSSSAQEIGEALLKTIEKCK